MNMDEYLKKYNKEYNLYIKDLEIDFFNLAEIHQDTILANPFVEIDKIWDYLTDEQKLFYCCYTKSDYMKVWDKLSDYLKNLLITHSYSFNIINHPEIIMDDKLLDILVVKANFDYDKYWENMNNNHINKVTLKNNFNYEKYWDRLNLEQRINVILENPNFDPIKYKEELFSYETFDNLKSTLSPLLDLYCKDNSESLKKYYKQLWHLLSDENKGRIINHWFYSITDEYEEILEIFNEKIHSYFQRTFISKKIIFTEIDIYHIKLIEKMTKNCHHHYEHLLFLEKIRSFENTKDLYPYCVVYIDKEYKNKKITLDEGYYLWFFTNDYYRLEDYHILLREQKLKNILEEL